MAKPLKEQIRETINEVNDEISESWAEQGADESPLWLQSRNVAKVKIQGQKKPVKVTRQSAKQGGAISMGSGLGQIAGVYGDWRPIQAIKEDVEWAFKELDEKLITKGVID